MKVRRWIDDKARFTSPESRVTDFTSSESRIPDFTVYGLRVPPSAGFFDKSHLNQTFTHARFLLSRLQVSVIILTRTVKITNLDFKQTPFFWPLNGFYR